MMYVDTVSYSLLQREELNCLPLQNICGGCEELVKAPTPLLASLQYTCQYWNQQRPQTPTFREA